MQPQHGLSTSTKRPPVRQEAHKPDIDCQSLAHHTTLTGRCFKSVDCWAPLCVELQGRSNIIQHAARQLIRTAVAPRAQLGSCQSLAHQATCAFMRFLSSDCWAPLSLEPQGRSTIVQSTINHKSLDEKVIFDETEADRQHTLLLCRQKNEFTLGFPGEGPLFVATNNIIGTRRPHVAVMAPARQAHV
eukprot:scaffold12838_cov144-Isochrysis_galbana.AAC.3